MSNTGEVERIGDGEPGERRARASAAAATATGAPSAFYVSWPIPGDRRTSIPSPARGLQLPRHVGLSRYGYRLCPSLEEAAATAIQGFPRSHVFSVASVEDLDHADGTWACAALTLGEAQPVWPVFGPAPHGPRAIRRLESMLWITPEAATRMADHFRTTGPLHDTSHWSWMSPGLPRDEPEIEGRPRGFAPRIAGRRAIGHVVGLALTVPGATEEECPNQGICLELGWARLAAAADYVMGTAVLADLRDPDVVRATFSAWATALVVAGLDDGEWMCTSEDPPRKAL